MRCSQIQHHGAVLGSSAGFDVVGLTTVIWVVWWSSSPFSRLSLELESVFDLWQCCPKSFSTLFNYFFFQKVTFPVRADVCHHTATDTAKKSLCTWTCLSILCATMMTKEPQRSTVINSYQQWFETVWSLAQTHRFSYPVGPLSAWSSFLSFHQIFSHIFFLTLFPRWLLVLL